MFYDSNTVQTTYTHGLQVFKFDNGQIEKHFKDSSKQIIFPDGTLKYILPNGYEETYFADGSMQKVEHDGTIIIERIDGIRVCYC
jgi:centromere protein J